MANRDYKKYHAENREKRNAYSREYYTKHREEATARRQKSRATDLVNRPWISSYMMAKYRCNNPNNKDYARYGGRGIKFHLTYEDCNYLWNRDEAWLLVRPSIDRKDNDGDYIRENCRFIEFADNAAEGARRGGLATAKKKKENYGL